MADDWLKGVESGRGLVGDILDRNLRFQQLQANQTLIRLREQAAAKELQLLIQKNDHEIQYRADMAKAVASAQMASSPTINVPMPDQEGLGDMAPPVMPIPNPSPLTKEQAAFRFIVPTVAKYDPEKVPDVLQNIALAEYRLKTESEFTPTAGQVTTPGGETMDFVKTSPRSAQLVIKPSVETIVNPETGKKTEILRTGTSSGRVIPQDIEGRQQRTMMAKWALQHAPELMEIDEDGVARLPAQNFNEAARRAGIPSGVKTDMMQQIAATAGAFEVGRKLLPLLTPENVGVRGMLSRKLEEQGLAQIFPGMKIGSATETLSVASNFRAGLVRALRSDSNINKDEREQIIEGLPTPENMLSSVQDSKIKLATQLELAAIKSRAAANSIGKPITPFYLKIDEIEQMIQSGSLKAEEGAMLWNNNAWRLIELIRQEVQR